MDKVLAWWTGFVQKMNEQGIPIPMIRADGKATITGTMAIVSFALCVVPVALMVATTVAKLSGLFQLNESNETQLMNAFSASIQLYIASMATYLGRGMQRGSDGKASLDKSDKPE